MDIGRTLPPNVGLVFDAEYQHLQARHEALLAVCAPGIIELDAEGRIVRWDAAAWANLGIRSDAPIGTPLRSLLVDGETNDPLADARALPRDLRLRFRTEAGIGEVVCSLIAITSQDASLGYFLALRRQQRYDEIEQLKNEFVGTISHELKTPLAAIKAYAQTLHANFSSGRPISEEYLTVIEEQTKRLESVIENLLLVTRVDAEYLLRIRSTVDLDHLLEQIISAFPDPACRTRIARSVTGVQVSGDPELLTLLFAALLDNAVKFSAPHTPVTISGHEESDRTLIRIQDQGIGIAHEDLPYIFERFYRAGQHLSTQTAGIGLGLFIARSIAQAHGGTIVAASTPGIGSTFTVSLPRKQ